MNKNRSIVSRNQNGEFIYHGLNSHIPKKHQPDTPLDQTFVPYFIMLVCAVIDASVFLNLFEMLSYDSPFMLGVQALGLLFGFDITPVYLGIHLRRLRQGLSKDRFILYLGFLACGLAFGLNIVLRLMTMDQISPDLSSVALLYSGTDAEDAVVNSADVALTIFGIVMPFITSIGSFFVSYLLYNPLRVRQRRQEEMLAVKRDECRRLEAILCEYEDVHAFAEHLTKLDQQKREAMRRMQRAKVVFYCDYVRVRFMEFLASPAAVNALSEEACTAVLNRLDQELAALDNAESLAAPQIDMDETEGLRAPSNGTAA